MKLSVLKKGKVESLVLPERLSKEKEDGEKGEKDEEAYLSALQSLTCTVLTSSIDYATVELSLSDIYVMREMAYLPAHAAASETAQSLHVRDTPYNAAEGEEEGEAEEEAQLVLQRAKERDFTALVEYTPPDPQWELKVLLFIIYYANIDDYYYHYIYE
jgi:hypothetical protein